MPRADLNGIIAAMLTPVDAGLAIDAGRLAAHAAELLDAGCTRVSTFGTTGEGVSFSRRQKLEAHRALIAAGIGPERMLPAVMCCSLDDAAGELADLAGIGCPYVLVLPPFYYADAGIEGLAAFFEAVYARAGRPELGIVLYNIPAMSRIAVSIPLVEALLGHGEVPVAGIKDSTGVLESGLAYLRAFPQLSIFTGDDRVLPPLLAAGGAGLIGGLPNLYAADLARLMAAPEGPQAGDLAALAARRIAEIDAKGGLLALKAALATRKADPAWARAMPPLMAPGR